MHADRVSRLVPKGVELANAVVIHKFEHETQQGLRLPEIVFAGDQPHHQAAPGPVKRLASPYRGVSFHACTQRWRSRIKHGTKSEHLGYFASDIDAAKAYNEAALKIHGENAQLNEGVDEVINEKPGIKSTHIHSERVEYTGQTWYVDRSATRSFHGRMRSVGEATMRQHCGVKVEEPAIFKPESTFVKSEQDYRGKAEQAQLFGALEPAPFHPLEEFDGERTCQAELPEYWDDLDDFLGLFSEAAPAPAEMKHEFAYQASFDCGLKRRASFIVASEYKRICA